MGEKIITLLPLFNSIFSDTCTRRISSSAHAPMFIALLILDPGLLCILMSYMDLFFFFLLHSVPLAILTNQHSMPSSEVIMSFISELLRHIDIVD